jgi:transposase-like protein
MVVAPPCFSSLSHFKLLLHHDMGKYTPAFKDRVLREYCAGDRRHSFRALARSYNIRGGPSVIHGWYQRWKGNPESLKRKPGSGGQRALTRSQVHQYICVPVERAYKKHVAVDYRKLKDPIEEAVGHPVSLRTIQQYGKEEADVVNKTTIPRTSNESRIQIFDLLCFYFSIGSSPYSQKSHCPIVFFQCPLNLALALPNVAASGCDSQNPN